MAVQVARRQVSECGKYTRANKHGIEKVLQHKMSLFIY